jgi:hypothetical protein
MEQNFSSSYRAQLAVSIRNIEFHSGIKKVITRHNSEKRENKYSHLPNYLMPIANLYSQWSELFNFSHFLKKNAKIQPES